MTKRKTKKKGKRARTRHVKAARRPNRVIRAKRRAPVRRKHARKVAPRRASTLTGALPLLGDTSPAGRRRLRLAEKLGLKVR